MNETAVVIKGKKPANQTQAYKATLNQIEAEVCEAYLKAIGYIKDGSVWVNPSKTTNTNGDIDVRTREGLISASRDGKLISGYELVTWLILGSKKKGLHHIMIGALVMAGVHDLNIFKELCQFNSADPDNVAFKVMKIADRARDYYKTHSDIDRDGDNGMSTASQKALDYNEQGPGVDNETFASFQDDEEGDPGDAENEAFVGNQDNQVNGEKVPRHKDDETFTDSVDFLDEDVSSFRDVQQPANAQEGAVQAYNASETQEILKAFNDVVPSEAECVRAFHRSTKSQFCLEIQIGRLLLQKKQDLKSSALFKKWKSDTFPEATFDKHVLSRCTRYGQFDKYIRSRRGLLLEEKDIKLCSKKAMLLIGGYKKRNVDELIDEVILRLDSDNYLSEDVVSNLVKKFKAKVTKSKREDEVTLPPVPRTVRELIELPEKWLSRSGKRHLTEIQELLEALESGNQSPTLEASVVLPLVKIFTVL